MRRINYLMACMVAVMTFTTGFAVNAQQEVLRPDLFVRGLVMKSKSFVTVSILNKGKADADGCYLMLFGMDASGKKWSKMYRFDPVAQRDTRQMTFGISPNSAGPGTSLLARIDSRESLDEVDETNNSRELLVPAEVPSDPLLMIGLLKIVPPAPPPTPTPTPEPPVKKYAPWKMPPQPPAPAEKILSPDIAAVAIRIEHDFMVGVLQNVGDSKYYAESKNYNKRMVTLKRIVYIGSTNHTEDIGTCTLGFVSQGGNFECSFPRPKFFPVPKKYKWILTIDGEDPNTNNNRFEWVQPFHPID